ncbi:putative flavin-containing amine oxidase, partial [Aspergillus steynii IBT 23096]
MFDVIVIDAGLSGLQAAYTAQQSGLSVAVVEARNRVGGKVWSVPLASGRGVADLGAAWVNDKKQRRIWSYAKQFGLAAQAQSLTGRAVMQLNENDRLEYPFGITPDFSPEEKRNLEYIRDYVQAETLKSGLPRGDDDKLTLDQYVRNLGALPKTIQMVNLWSKAMHGVESTQQSAAFFIDYCRRNTGLLAVRADDETGGNYLRFHEGAQSIAHGLARLIGTSQIHLDSPVISIEDHKTHISVTAARGRVFVGRKCILSIPSTMYRELNISPALPSAVQTVSQATCLGNYNKVIVCYDKPWWKELGYNGFFMSYNGGPLTLGRDTSVTEKRLFALTCFVQGDQGLEWTKLPPHERRAAVLHQLAKIFDTDRESELYRPIEIFEQIWKFEEFSRGALVPITALGHLTEYAAVYGRPAGNLHFVGTEYAREWKGYMEGALCSGEEGGWEVVESLKQ